MKQAITAAIAGSIFGLGLAVSGMINPAKVIGFLDFAGNWDPSLVFVLAGATGITAVLYPLVFRKQKPLFEDHFHLSTNTKIQPQLLIGAAIFGIGWGLVGLCPGPAFASLSIGGMESIAFVLAMFTGLGAYRLLRNFLVSQQVAKKQTT